MAHYTSKHGNVARRKEELYMAFCDLGNLTRMLPEEQKQQVSITADYDNLAMNIQGFTIAIRVSGRVPFSLIQLEDHDAPFHFGISLHFDDGLAPASTDFWVEVEADLNIMMKTMLGGKIKEGLDKLVDTISAQ